MEVTKRIHKNLAAAQRARPAIIAVSASAFSVCTPQQTKISKISKNIKYNKYNKYNKYKKDKRIKE